MKAGMKHIMDQGQLFHILSWTPRPSKIQGSSYIALWNLAQIIRKSWTCQLFLNLDSKQKPILFIFFLVNWLKDTST